MRKTLGLVLVLGTSLLPLRAAAASGDDDLALVRKALQSPGAEGTKPAAKPRWIHVRVEGKKDNKEKVSINVPFALLEAFSDQDLLQDCKVNHKPIHLGELIKTLEPGQQLVEVADE